MRRSGFGIWIGLAIMIVSEAATLRRVEPFWSWNTPIAWTGFILFADSIVWRARGESWMRSSPREFAALVVLSIPLWLVFEFYNLFIVNWHYVGLPENAALRYFGYAWSFATIWPAIFEGADLIAVWRGTSLATADLPAYALRAPARSRHSSHELRASGGGKVRPTSDTATFRPAELLSIAAGAVMLIAPFAVAPSIAVYLAAPVWLGFIFLLDPINRRLGGDSLAADLERGNRDRLINLAISGVVCGVLWEFWNYWAHAKWHYTVPIMENLKIFEMPVPGYLGFPAFALECFTMYMFCRCLATLWFSPPVSAHAFSR